MADLLNEAIAKALEASESIPDELKPAGFGVLLAHFLADREAPTTQSSIDVQPSSSGLPATLPEFIALKKPKSHPQYVTYFAYFSFKSGDRTGLTFKEIEQAYQEIRKKKPQNLSDVIAACVGRGRGWLIAAPSEKNGSKAWLISGVGEQAVENNFKTS